MTWHNDRRVVEHLIWPLMVESFATSQMDCQETDEEKASVERICAGARAFAAQLIGGMEPDRQAKLVRRALRASQEAAQILEGKHGGTVGAALYYAIEELLSADSLWIEEGSSLGDALLEVLESLKGHFDTPKIDAAGRKNGRRFLNHLINQGFYAGHRARAAAGEIAA